MSLFLFKVEEKKTRKRKEERERETKTFLLNINCSDEKTVANARALPNVYQYDWITVNHCL